MCDRDQGYAVELAVPWRALGVNAPQAGQAWLGNLASHDPDAGARRMWLVDRDYDRPRRDWLGRLRFE